MSSRLIRFILIASFCFTLASAATAADPSGRWRGSWTSRSTGHRGALRARVRQVDANTYRALFAGRFAVVVPFLYPAKLERVPGTSDCFRTTTRLPLLGEYRMTAHVSRNRFYAVYSGGKENGIFDLSR
ncbi:MAG: hypothetical protein AAFX06_26870 [Planctomycetota bacterium]